MSNNEKRKFSPRSVFCIFKSSVHVGKAIGQSLIYRTTRQVELTALGSKLYSLFHQHIEAIEQGIAQSVHFHENLRGTLRITAPEDIGVVVLTKILSEFTALNPFVDMELIYSERVLNLVEEAIDVAIRVGKPKQKSARIKRLGNIQFMLVASPAFLQKYSRTFRTKDLESADFISSFPRKSSNKVTLVNGQKSRQVSIRPKFSSGSMLARCELACEGKGIAVVPRFLGQKAISEGRLSEVCHGWAPAPRPLMAATFSKRGTSPINRHFIDFVSDRIPPLLNG